MYVLDISNVNAGPIHFATIREHGIDDVYLKRSEGMTFNDPLATRYEKAAISAGMRVGWYHFARNDRNRPEAEAEHFGNLVKQHLDPAHHLRPCLDFEVAPDPLWPVAFNHKFHEITGLWPLFYSYADLIRRCGFKRPVGDGLWLAAYSRNDGKEHQFFTPAPYHHVAMHQFTSRAKVIGCPALVDLSHVIQPKVIRL